MNANQISPLFRRSLSIGIIYELVHYGVLLLCGYQLSDLLAFAMAAAWQEMYAKADLSAAVLVCSLLPLYALSCLRSHVRLTDTQRFRECLYQGIIDGTIPIHDRGELDVRLHSNVSTIADYFQQTCPNAITGLAVMLCSTALLCLVDSRIGLIFFFLNLIQLLPILVYEKWTRNIYNQTHSDEEAYQNWLLEGYGGIRTIKAYGLENWYMERFYRLNHVIVRSGNRAERAVTLENIVFAAIDSLLKYGSYVIIGLFVLFGGLEMENTPLVIILAGYLFSSIHSVFQLWLQRFHYQEAGKRLGFRGRVIEYPNKRKKRKSAEDCPAENGIRMPAESRPGERKHWMLTDLCPDKIEKQDLTELCFGEAKQRIPIKLRLNEVEQQDQTDDRAEKSSAEKMSKGFPVLTVQGVYKAFEGKPVLQDVSFAIHAGDRVLLRGENGSGKSTLLRMITGLEQADKGQVCLAIPQNRRTFSLQTEPDLNLSGQTLADALCESACADPAILAGHFRGFQIQDLLPKPLSQLSPGERKKFYLSAALSHPGDLLILDEPTNHLDQSSVTYLTDRLRIYPGTLIVCTHAAHMEIPWNRQIRIEEGTCRET